MRGVTFSAVFASFGHRFDNAFQPRRLLAASVRTAAAAGGTYDADSPLARSVRRVFREHVGLLSGGGTGPRDPVGTPILAGLSAIRSNGALEPH